MSDTCGVDVDTRIRRELDRVASRGRAGEILWRIRSDDGAVDFTYGDPERPFFIASATKLYVAAILAQLKDEGRIEWTTPLARYLPGVDLGGLAVLRGRDAADEITVQQVMAHTAGLPDYFEGRRPGGSTFSRALKSDFGWRLDDVLTWSREIGPGRPGRSRYSDTGYQLLGAVIEHVDGRPFAQSLRKRICEPLGLQDTYVFSREDVDRYASIASLRVGVAQADIPLVMASVQADGGIVSTTSEALRFAEAFFAGALFPASTVDWMASDWHRIFFPLEYGNGVMRFRMPAPLTGFRRVPPFIGHSGASGTVMFRSPDLRLTVAGTVNQIETRSLSFQLLVRTALAASRR